MDKLAVSSIMIALLLWGEGSALGRSSILAESLPRMDSVRLAEREEAVQGLSRVLRDDSSEQAIEAARAVEASIVGVLRSADLSLEQRVRLLELLRDRFFGTPRGAIGISFAQGQVPMQTGVRIERAMEGFASKDQDLLRGGDVITHVDGVPLIEAPVASAPGGFAFAPQERMRRMVFSHDPGDVVRLTIVRALPKDAHAANPAEAAQRMAAGAGDLITVGPNQNAEVLTVDVPLGSFDRLGNGGLNDRSLLEGAWQERASRLGIPSPDAARLDSGVPHHQWEVHGRVITPKPRPGLRCDDGRPGAAEAIGQALSLRGHIDIPELRPAEAVRLDPRIQRLIRTPNVGRAVDPGGVKAGRIRVGDRELQAPVPREEDMIVIFQRITSMTQQKEQLLRQAQDAALPMKDREEAARGAAQLDEQINRFDRVLQRKVGEAAEAAHEAKP